MENAGSHLRYSAAMLPMYAAHLSPRTVQAALALNPYMLPPDLLSKAQALEHWRTALYFGGFGWTLLTLFLLVRGRAGERVGAFAARLAGSQHAGVQHPFLEGLVVAPLWLLLVSLLNLPQAALGHRVSLCFGLSIERWGAWLADWGLSTLLLVGMGTLVLSGLYALLRRTPRLAWLSFWLGTLPFLVLGVFAAPLVIDPLFNHFTPLAERDPALVLQLERVVTRGGLAIPPSRIFVMDASRRLTGMNAYVTGFGASKRVVVWDTTLPGGPAGKTPGAGVPVEELLDIYGHEQGHYVLGHIWKGMLYSAALLLFFFWLTFQLLQSICRGKGEAWHIAENPADWSSVGLLLLLATALAFLADPLANAFSRMEEHEADVYGQEVIHGLVADPQAVAVADEIRLGRAWLEDPQPNRFVVWWSYTHPPVSDRAAFAAAYNPWANGGHGRYFRR